MPCPSETRLQAFVEGDLTPDEIADITRHLDTCPDCRTLIGLAQPVALDDDSTPDRVGRYVLRRVLGKGGMGIVYEAVDPDLHRIVALKVLRSGLEDTQKRLLAEAEAMAKLSHPNVVTIHDVGRTEDRIFIVMELVQGASLRSWLTLKRHSIDTIIDVFVQAAEGLVAAHQAGLVHRDFKPENVFIAEDGRVRVGDFGLAVPLGAEPAAGEGSSGYMAPEQREGRLVDARSDQYAFCVAMNEVVRATGHASPAWLSKALDRGRSSDPDARYPSMRALVDELRSGRSRVRNMRIGAAVVFCILVASAAWILHGGSRPIRCDEGRAEISMIWNAGAALRVEQAIRGTKSPLAEGTWRKAERALSGYANEWSEVHERACQQAAGKDDASGLLDRKLDCLSDRLGIFRAVVSRLEQADAPMLEQLPAMLQLLPPIGACEDTNQLAQLPAAPPAEKRAAVDAARAKLATTSATITAGRYEQGLDEAKDAWQSAKATGHFPIIAEAYLWLGIAHGRLGHTRECEEAFDQAVSAATAGRAQMLAVRAWIQLMHFVGLEGRRHDDGYRYADYARAALESMPGAAELEVERLAWLRAMLLDQRRYQDALDVSRQELALVQLRIQGSNHRLAIALDGRAGVLSGQCKARDAIEPQRHACEILESELGTPHPQLALCLGNLAGLHAKLGDHGEALALKRRALSMFTLLPGHPNHVAMARRNLVRSLTALNQLDEARRELEAASAISDSESARITIAVLRGELLHQEGKLNEATESFSIAVQETNGLAAARRLEPLLLLSEASLESGNLTQALDTAEQAVDAARSVFGNDDCQVAVPLRLKADALTALGRTDAALPTAERALASLAGSQLDPLVRARVEMSVARALPEDSRDRRRDLATSAITAARSRDPQWAESVERWIAQQP